MKISILRKEEKKKENTKQNLNKHYQHWNDWKLKIHWNKLEWVVTKRRNVREKSFCISSQKFYLKIKLLKTIGLNIH